MDTYGSQLIVLGNGFDLKAGLSSRYADFFNDRFGTKTVRDARDQIDRDLKRNAFFTRPNANMWDIIFAWESTGWEESGKGDWKDVESVIQDWVTNHDRLRLLVRLVHSEGPTWQSDIPEYSKHGPTLGKVDGHLLARLIYFINFHRESQSPGGYASETLNLPWLYNLLLNNLNCFESAFRDYLINLTNGAKAPSVINGSQYDENSRNLLDVIAALDVEGNLGDLSVLSFNYTTPALHRGGSSGISTPMVKTWRNVHGRIVDPDGCPGHIIFGIDDTMLFPTPAASSNYPEQTSRFSKTFRVMEHPSPTFNPGQEPVDLFDRGHGSFDAVKFYGHSLADADYSYFKAIFDEINLYDGDTALYFLYSRHEGFDITENIHKPVYRLMRRYSQELGAYANIMHKLLLEDRIRIREVDSPSSEK
jgi:hypothetical protein